MIHAARAIFAAIERHRVGGWCLLAAGLGLIGLVMLTPTWLDLQQAREQCRLMRRQLDQAEQHRANYRMFITHLAGGDPLLLQRLAWHQLHRKPQGVMIFDDHCPAEPGATIHFEQWLEPDDASAPKPAPVPESRLVRLTTSPLRLGLLATGVAFLAAALIDSARAPIPPTRRLQ